MFSKNKVGTFYEMAFALQSAPKNNENVKVVVLAGSPNKINDFLGNQEDSLLKNCNTKGILLKTTINGTVVELWNMSTENANLLMNNLEKNAHLIIFFNLSNFIKNKYKTIYFSGCEFIDHKPGMTLSKCLKNIVVDKKLVSMANTTIRLLGERSQNPESIFNDLPKELIIYIAQLNLASLFRKNSLSFDFFKSVKNYKKPEFYQSVNTITSRIK
jgi:hypothetical protein